MRRNLYIDLVKIALAIVVAFGHFGISFRIDAGFAVTAFFIISGFYLAKGSKKASTFSYIVKRVKKMYLKYIIVFIAAFVFTIRNWINGGFSSRGLIDTVQEAILLQGLGFTKTSVNPTMWFFSVLLIASGGLYCLYKNFPKATQYILLPIVSIGGYLLFCQPIDPWGMLSGVIYVPLIRGVYSLSLGGLAYYILPYYRKIPKVLKYVLTAVSIMGSLIIGSSNNIYTLLIVFIFMFLLQCEQVNCLSVVENCLSKISYLSENVYYCHYVIILVLKGVFKRVQIGSVFVEGAVYIICVLICAVIFEKIISAIKNRTGNRERRIGI